MSSTDRRRAPLLFALGLAAAGLLAPAPSLAQAGANKIVYDTFAWEVYSSTHFQIYHYSREKELVQKVSSLAESAYDELSRRLNYQIPKQVPLIFYATHADFEQNNIIMNFIPEGVGAFAEPARNRMVLPVDLSDEKLQQLIQHELTHVFEYEILFGGRLSRALTSSAPTWFMEGLASYFGQDEDDKDRMFLRDAVNADQIPPITRVDMQGYVAYRYGHAVFDFIEAEWGKDAVREFIYEFRSFMGRDVGTALKRAFDIDPDEFDLKFRRYLRRKYLPLLAVKGEASEYGQRFRVGASGGRASFEISAAPSPSGEFVACFTTQKDDVDIALISTRDRKLYKNLTPGKTTKYEYLSAQFLTSAPESGRDLSFAPDGDRIAVFARRERGRELFIFSARTGTIVQRLPVAPDMPLSPAFSPDGKFVVFSGISGNTRDIFLVELATGILKPLSRDEAFDVGPVFSPDGKWIYHSKVVNGLYKIVRFPLEDPSKVEQVTWGDGQDEDPFLAPDGKRLFFASSRNGGVYNIFAQDLATGELVQYTDVIGAALGPAVYTGTDGQEKVVFSGFQGQRFQLYVADTKKPIRRLDEKALPPTPLGKEAVAGFVPAVEVSVDPEKFSKVPKFKLFLEDASLTAAIATDQTFLSQVQLVFSDMLGNKRAFVIFDSVSTLSNFRLGYFDLTRRTQWGFQIYDNRQYFYGVDENGFINRDKRYFKETGITFDIVYPLSRYTRLTTNVGYISRTLDVPYYVSNADGTQGAIYEARSDTVPTGGVGYAYDSTRYASWGPAGGSSLTANFQYTPDFVDGGTLTQDLFGEARHYAPVSRRTLFAFRAFAASSKGVAPTVFYFGGLDTLRGYDYRTQIGNNIFYVNTEFRFPLIDVISMPFLALGGIRGRVFLDVGGAWLNGQPFQFWDGDNNQIKDGLSSYGVGVTFFFLGVPWNIDVARPWNFHHTVGDTQVTFYIGGSF